jgi:hypothetical protein
MRNAYTGHFSVCGPHFDHILDTSHDAFSQLNQTWVISRTTEGISIRRESWLQRVISGSGEAFCNTSKALQLSDANGASFLRQLVQTSFQQGRIKQLEYSQFRRSRLGPPLVGLD